MEQSFLHTYCKLIRVFVEETVSEFESFELVREYASQGWAHQSIRKMVFKDQTSESIDVSYTIISALGRFKRNGLTQVYAL